MILLKPCAYGYRGLFLLKPTVKRLASTEVEKRCEKGDVTNKNDREQEVSMLNLGAKKVGCTRDLVRSGWKPDAVEAAGKLDEEEQSLTALTISEERTGK